MKNDELMNLLREYYIQILSSGIDGVVSKIVTKITLVKMKRTVQQMYATKAQVPKVNRSRATK